MQLDDFLFNLHFDIDKVRPVDAEVDWADAPLPFKLYQGLPSIPLPKSLPPASTTARTPLAQPPSLEELASFFWYSYGLTQVCHVVLPIAQEGQEVSILHVLRRYVPSGGALYPSEVYAYLHTDEVPAGVYHYDVAHHRLVLLRPGNYDTYLQRALGHRFDVSESFGAVFVSTAFWKNYFKYRDFSYRLQGLDAGVVIGQVLALADQCGYGTSVFFQFLDSAINHLLGLQDEEESVYAVVPLRRVAGSSAVMTREGTPCETDDTLCREIPPLHHRHYVRSQSTLPYPLLREVNQAAMTHTTHAFHKATADEGATRVIGRDWVPLPSRDETLPDFATACKRRFSPGLEFVPGGISLEELATLLNHTMSLSYNSDVDDGSSSVLSRIGLAACAHGIGGVPDGAYLYDQRAHGLRLLRPGDVRMDLQLGLSMPTVNMFQVPLCLHLVGSSDFHRGALGYRGYRIQQMETGILLQRLLLTAARLGVAGHPLLGYDEAASDRIYQFDSKRQTCLIEVPLGRYRKTSRFEGELGLGNRKQDSEVE